MGRLAQPPENQVGGRRYTEVVPGDQGSHGEKGIKCEVAEVKFCDLSVDFLLSSWLCALRGSGRSSTPTAVGTPGLDLHVPSPCTGTSQGAPEKCLTRPGTVAAEPGTGSEAEKQGSI